MDSIGRLAVAVEDAYRAAEVARHPSDVGAVEGVMQNESMVCIKGRSYHAVLVSDIRPVQGIRVWCQIADNYRAVVVGGV